MVTVAGEPVLRVPNSHVKEVMQRWVRRGGLPLHTRSIVKFKRLGGPR